MKRTMVVVTAVIALLLCASCVSLQDREMAANERAQAQVLGKVSAEFHSWQFFHIINEKGIKNKAYNELLKKARLQYEGNIDVRNISMTGGGSWWQLLNSGGYVGGGCSIAAIIIGYPEFGIPFAVVGFGLAGNTQKITATGDVVLFGTAPGGSAAPVPPNAPGGAPAPGTNF